MASAYHVNYHLRAHKRDAFIEFIKSLLLSPFILHSRPSSISLVSSPLELLDSSNPLDDLYIGVVESSESSIKNEERYAEIMKRLEELIVDHILHQNAGVPQFSRLTQLVPSIGMFFTPLPLRESFIRNNKTRAIAGRRFVPPSFNDVRHILNSAQIMAVAPTLKLITFDGDMTLYADGADFAQDSQLVSLLVNLLNHNLFVAIVTAAGYANDSQRYEKRLSGLLDGMRQSDLSPEQLGRFYVFGGECNYLFRFDAGTGRLREVDGDVYQTEKVKRWAKDTERIGKLLDEAGVLINECVGELGIKDRVNIIRKERAIGIVPVPGTILSRELQDEIALAFQLRLKNIQTMPHYKQLKQEQKTQHFGSTSGGTGVMLSDNLPPPIPFCAFSGGRDVWIDIGNKLIGVELLQQYLNARENETLHLGDQFLGTGNDLATRRCCTTVWITNPLETAEALVELEEEMMKNKNNSQTAFDCQKTPIMDYSHLLPPAYKKLVESWILEDTPTFDYGGFVVGEEENVALLYGKDLGVLAGVPFFTEVFRQLGCRVEWNVTEGSKFYPDSTTGRIEIAKVYGPTRQILLGERPALNMIARASGIATRARRLLELKEKHNWKGIIAGTRKTTPGFRIVEKYAMLVGGVDTHRMDLSSMIMLKDNHVWATGSITLAIHKARSVGGFALKIEVECRTKDEANEAIAAGADIIMLDNYDGKSIGECAKELRESWKGKKEFLVEGSGGLTEENVAEYFCDDVDILSFGSLSQSVPHIDFSLKIKQT
ncbi:hypothetical protein HK098_000271 [Nowakowskiella sp. JEL0407]|nr:hypothetical protein HK098_000271 [Nowakowskiella sp. JEL0407]